MAQTTEGSSLPPVERGGSVLPQGIDTRLGNLAGQGPHQALERLAKSGGPLIVDAKGTVKVVPPVSPIELSSPQEQAEAPSPPAQAEAQIPPTQAEAQIPPAQAEAQIPPAQAEAQIPPAQAEAPSPSAQEGAQRSPAQEGAQMPRESTEAQVSPEQEKNQQERREALEKTPEQKLNEAGDELVEALVTGKDLERAVVNFTQAQMEREGLTRLTNEGLMRNAASEVVAFLKANPFEIRKGLNWRERRQLRFQKEIQERIRYIIGLEIEFTGLTKRMDVLKTKASEVKGKLLKCLPSLKKPLDDEQARKERMEFYGLLMQMANLKAAAIQTRHAGEILSIQLSDLRREVMAKAGMFKGIGGLLSRFADWAATRAKSFLLEAEMNLEGEFDLDPFMNSARQVGLTSL